MTEDQARVTQCCGGEGCGYVNPDDKLRYCIGSACMAWREQMRSETIKGDTRAEDHIVHHVEGFCGLAGKP